MLINIDVDKLHARRAELEEELKRINSLLDLVQTYDAAYLVQQHDAAPAAPTPGPGIPVSDDGPRRGFTAGLRRQVLLALHTGPCTHKELGRALAWSDSRVRRVTFSMQKFKLIFLTEHGRLQLSDEGHRQADWYLANPKYLTYRPGTSAATA